MASEANQPLWESDPKAWAFFQEHVKDLEAEHAADEARAIIDRAFPR